MNWDGKAVSGIINPGPDAITIDRVSIDFADWSVRIEADAKPSPPIVAEGRIEDLASTHRSIRGSWSQGDVKGEFHITRD